MMRYLTALLVAGLLVTGTPRSAEAAINDNVHVIGDSITWRSTDNLRSLGVKWRIDGVPGRTIGTLGDLIAARMARGPAPRVLVVALGSNATEGYTEEDFRAALAQVPSSTRIVLVTPYRNPYTFDANRPQTGTPTTSAEYKSMMRHIAASRPRTCIAGWAGYAHRHRTLLPDGLHPSGPYKPRWGAKGEGQQAWAKVVRNAVRECRTHH